MMSALVQGIHEIGPRLADRLDNRRAEVIAMLRSVAAGETEMVETIAQEERAQTQDLFFWAADALEHGDRVRHALDSLGPATSKSFEMLDEFVGAVPGKFSFPVPLPHPAHGLPAVDKISDQEKHQITRFAVLLLSYVFYEDFHYPQRETGRYNVAGDMFEKLKWVYRYWFNQLEVAEKDSGLEAFFAAQTLRNEVAIDDFDLQSVQRASLSCAGDLLAVDVLLEARNTERLFDDLLDFYSSTDIVNANLESPVDMSKTLGRDQAPGEAARMNTSEAVFHKFRDEAGISFFSTATNHALDWDEEGALATLEVLGKSGAAYAGTAASREQQDDVVVVERNGIKIALLAFTFDLNGHAVPAGKEYLVNEVRFNDADPVPDYSLVERHVAAARAKGAEFIVAYCHWGWEFEMYPHVNVTEAAHRVVGLGVDVILGNHPHVSQPAQVIERGEGMPKALVIYAFGDFVSYHPESRNSKLAYAIAFDIVKCRSQAATYVSWDSVASLPLYIVNAPGDDGSHDCRIMQFDKVLANPDDFGLTQREKDELPHLRDVVWNGILSPVSHIPPGPQWTPRLTRRT